MCACTRSEYQSLVVINFSSCQWSVFQFSSSSTPTQQQHNSSGGGRKLWHTSCAACCWLLTFFCAATPRQIVKPSPQTRKNSVCIFYFDMYSRGRDSAANDLPPQDWNKLYWSEATHDYELQNRINLKLDKDAAKPLVGVEVLTTAIMPQAEVTRVTRVTVVYLILTKSAWKSDFIKI